MCSIIGCPSKTPHPPTLHLVDSKGILRELGLNNIHFWKTVNKKGIKKSANVTYGLAFGQNSIRKATWNDINGLNHGTYYKNDSLFFNQFSHKNQHKTYATEKMTQMGTQRMVPPSLNPPLMGFLEGKYLQPITKTFIKKHVMVAPVCCCLSLDLSQQ